MMDEQIINRCEKCKVIAQRGILIMNWCGFWLCGKCCQEAMNKERELKKKVIFE